MKTNRVMEIDAEMEAFAAAQGIKAKRSLRFAASGPEGTVPLSTASNDSSSMGAEHTRPLPLPALGPQRKPDHAGLPVAAGHFDPTVASPQQFKRPWRIPRPSALLGDGKPRKALILTSNAQPVEQALVPTEEYRDKAGSSQGDSQGDSQADSQDQEGEEVLGGDQAEVCLGQTAGKEGQENGDCREGNAARDTLAVEATSVPLGRGEGSSDLPRKASLVRMAHALAIGAAEAEPFGANESGHGLESTVPLSSSRGASQPDDVHMASPGGKDALHRASPSKPLDAGEADVSVLAAAPSRYKEETRQKRPGTH